MPETMDATAVAAPPETAPPAEEAAPAEIDPMDDVFAADVLGITAIVGTTWWVLNMFIYWGNDSDDVIVPANPNIWMWNNFTSTTVGWQAASYIATFVSYILIGVIELVAYAMLQVGDGQLLRYWQGTIGYYGVWILLLVGPLFATFHLMFPVTMGGINNNNITVGYTNDWFLIITGYILWLGVSVMHVIFAPRAAAYADTVKRTCICTSAFIPPGASEKEAIEAEDRARDDCEVKCSMSEMSCELDSGKKREDFKSYALYKDQCRTERDARFLAKWEAQIREQLKAKRAAMARRAPEFVPRDEESAAF